eukprot:CAMPEP_0172386406 /NCGR_PEP_ID=MMETSP1061-20121228/3972_1 /TAXON_ID=37318 /ORGANISM="Pseudo-nitzschia pungens, Strain cf. pungens" /LENGTH=1289 /DNA_ID=CAMNT_0013115787 /DNA_START=259 /DNA_END=4128 /DNA_ORIENTATION=-
MNAVSTTAAADTIAKDVELLDSIDLSSTMDLHRSNLMRMQVSELLEECQLDLKGGRKWAVEAHDYLQTITQLAEKASERHFVSKEKEGHPYSVRDKADKVVHIEKLPAVRGSGSGIVVEPLGCTKTRFGWTKKAGNAQQLPTFSLMVKLSEEFFSPKDYLKHRYFDKRNFIMDKFAQHFSKHTDKLGSIEYKWPKGSGRSPYLQLVPNPTKSSKSSSSSKTKGAKFQVHLHFGMQSIDWIPQLRLVPNRCNIKDHEGNDEKQSSRRRNKLIQSQLYNQSLLFDARHEFEDEHLSSEELVDHPNVEATLVLIQIWALQRGLWRNHDGWTKENVAIFLLYMLRTNRMNPRMTPIQQFTVVLQMWSTTNWLGTGSSGSGSGSNENGNHRSVRASQSEATQFSKTKRGRRDVLVLPEEDSTEKETMRSSDLARLYEKQTKESPLTNNDPSTLVDAYASLEHYALGPVLLDPTMTYNYLGDVSPNYMKLLRFHATRGLEGLKSSRSAFSHMFMKNARFWSQWDMYVKIPIRKKSDGWEASTRCLLEKLELALGNRIRGMRVLSTGNGDRTLEPNDLDQIPCVAIDQKSSYKERAASLPPTPWEEIVLGISIDPETSHRVVDRGPPSDQQKEVKSFLQLWGSKAQLRRFKDGAIVQAVVWNDDDGKEHYHNEVKLQGGFITKIVRHIVQLQYTKEKIEFALPNLLSVVDEISGKKQDTVTQPLNPIVAHQNVMKAFESLSQFLRQGSNPTKYQQQNQTFLELPLAIDAVEPLSPCLRYSELFPPVPHPFLGGPSSSSNKKVAGAIVSDPVLVQIRFESSSKWPSDLKAIGAAKTAMLIKLANAIEGANDRNFDGPIHVTTNYLDLGYKGYCFRILIRADPEIKLLRGLVKPSPVAVSLLKTFTRVHIVAAKHHSMMHAVHTLHPSSAAVVRLAKRWVANHMLSGLITTEAIELMVAKVYSDDESPLETPSTVMAGFLRFLHLLAHHDWLGEPLIVDPRGHIDSSDCDEIHVQFEKARGEKGDAGHPMYIITPYDKLEVEEDDPMNRNSVKTSSQSIWQPNTIPSEWVCLTRSVALAKRSYSFMLKKILAFTKSSDWSAIFHESPASFQSYSVLLRVNTDFVLDKEASSTGNDLNPSPDEHGTLESSYSRSMKARIEGPKGLRRKVYKNIQNGASDETILQWQPIRSVISSLREKFGAYALFFYNELSPEVIGLVWRPQTVATLPFSAMTAEYARPLDDDERTWKNDSLVIRNATDLLREMSEYYQYVITTVKIIDESCFGPSSKRRKLAGKGSNE